MAVRIVGGRSQYALVALDADGDYLDGSKTDRADHNATFVGLNLKEYRC